MRAICRPLAVLVSAALVAAGTCARVHAWGAQGHRVVAAIASDLLSPDARREAASLLDGQTLADVAVWADEIRDDLNQTAGWHYVNIPPDASAYSRDRDCPRQPRVSAGSPADRWRDCIVDRIDYHRMRLASRSLDRADRAVALKFLVHLVGDIHQPFHAIGVAAGGNGIPVSVFGSNNCAVSRAAPPRPCNLHGAWDVALVAHRELDDRSYVDALARRVRIARTAPASSAASWAMESLRLAEAALVPAHGSVDEAYYRVQIDVVDEQIARAGVRLAALLDAALGPRAAARRR
ncbi:MAG: S1/P1 nuclease [Vicinamibacterales bacterium]